MIIRGGKVFTEEGTFVNRDLCTKNDRIVDQKEADSAVIFNAEGKFLIPGLIDVHSHGAVGEDFSDGSAEGLRKLLRYEAEHGVTTYCPTTLTLPKEEILKAMDSAVEVISGNMSGLASIGGIHLEGPFVSKEKCGAQNPAHILQPEYELAKEAKKRSKGLVKLITLAPELQGALELIKQLKAEGIHASVGHTTAGYDTAREAFEAGADHVTHLYNAMPPFLHRNPGVIGAAADATECFTELITDGIHVDPAVVRATFKLMGPEKVVIISDSLRAAGLKDGEYEIGGQSFRLENGVARLSDGTIAGAATSQFENMRRAISFGVPAKEAIFAATANPAKSIGIYGEVGSLSIGKRADILVLNEDYSIYGIVLRGVLL